MWIAYFLVFISYRLGGSDWLPWHYLHTANAGLDILTIHLFAHWHLISGTGIFAVQMCTVCTKLTHIHHDRSRSMRFEISEKLPTTSSSGLWTNLISIYLTSLWNLRLLTRHAVCCALAMSGCLFSIDQFDDMPAPYWLRDFMEWFN